MERGTIYNQIDICCLDRYKTFLKKAHAQYNADNQSFARQLILFVRLLAVIYASIAHMPPLHNSLYFPRQIWVLWDTEKFFVSYYKYNIRGNSASIECKGEKTENIKSEKLEGGVTDALLKKHENNNTATRTEQTDLR